MPHTLWYTLHRLPDLSLGAYSALPNSQHEALLAQFSPSLRMLHRLALSYTLELRWWAHFDPNRPSGQRLELALGFAGQAADLEQAPIDAMLRATPIAPYFVDAASGLQRGCIQEAATPGTAPRLLGCQAARLERYWALNELGDEAFQRQSELPAYLHAVYPWEANEGCRLVPALQLMQQLGEACVITLALQPSEGEQEYDRLQPYYASALAKLAGGSYKDALGRTEFIKAGPVAEQLRSLRQDLMDKIRCEPCFTMQLRCYASTRDKARMLTDTVLAEALSNGPHTTWPLPMEVDYFAPAPADMLCLPPPAKVSLPADLQRLAGLFTLSEVASLFRLPVLYEGEALDLRKETYPEIDTVPGRSLHLGHLQGAGSAGESVHLPLDAMVKHTIVVGVPGSGKTNTLMSLARQVWVDHQVPFLVLEPAKREYRGLLNLPGCSGQVLLFAPGRSAPTEWLLEEQFNPLALRINPFEMPVGYSVAEHRAQLLQIFKVAFGLWNPLPSLVGDAITQVYAELGWLDGDIATTERIERYGLPQMRRFVEVVYELVSSTSYQGDNAATVKAYLEYQIGSLIKPPLAAVFDCATSTLSPQSWLHRPAIVELESLGEANANFVSLLLQCYLRQTLTVQQEVEREAQHQAEPGRKLRHLLFLEEAHNLIGPQAYIPDEKTPDPKAAATVFVVKLLAEVRALGLGIVIGDQLPSALAPEVLKNTSIRICHRLSAPDDRTQMQQSMNASALQFEHMATQTSGQALVGWEGVRKPFAMQLLAADGKLARHDQAFSDRAMLLAICQPQEQQPPDARFVANALELYTRVEVEIGQAPYPWQKRRTIVQTVEALRSLPTDTSALTAESCLPAPGVCMQAWLHPTAAEHDLPPAWSGSDALALGDVMLDTLRQRYRCVVGMLRWLQVRLEQPGVAAVELERLAQDLEYLKERQEGLEQRIQNLTDALAHAGQALVHANTDPNTAWTLQSLDWAVLILRLAATLAPSAGQVPASIEHADQPNRYNFSHLGFVPDGVQTQKALEKMLAKLVTCAPPGESIVQALPFYLRGPLRGVLSLTQGTATIKDSASAQRTRQRLQSFINQL